MSQNIPRFKANTLKGGMESVVGNCNGHTCEERMEVETPLFARAILSCLPKDAHTILDYGCGIGRLAKEILKQNSKITILGLDASEDELRLAEQYVSDNRFIRYLPEELIQKVDMVYCIYVLQHVPAIELRHAIERMYHHLKPGGKLVYCSSDYRMAINQDGGFTDDRHLGVDIRKELSRLFQEESDLFPNMAKQPKIIQDLITAEGCPPGSIAHPAKVYRKRQIQLDADQPYFKAPFPLTAEALPEARTPEKEQRVATTGQGGPKRLILRNRLSPGDILVMTAAVRSLHKAYPGKYLTDVDSPCPEIFENNPLVKKFSEKGQVIDMHYPLISDHQMRGFEHPGAGVSGRHFSDGHRKFLEEALECEIPRSGLVPDIYLSQDERLWPSPALGKGGWSGKYWVINAGAKSDFPLKQYHRYQKVVDLLKDKIQFVQIGMKEHNHEPLEGVIDLRGQTNHRELFRLIHHAEGVLTCVSYPMHIAAAFLKPCVVVAGGRESTRWELYPNHRFLHTNGALSCCQYDGCWKSKLDECINRVEYNHSIEKNCERFLVPKCMDILKPSMIVEAIELYYEGGILQLEEVNV